MLSSHVLSCRNDMLLVVFVTELLVEIILIYVVVFIVFAAERDAHLIVIVIAKPVKYCLYCYVARVFLRISEISCRDARERDRMKSVFLPSQSATVDTTISHPPSL